MKYILGLITPIFIYLLLIRVSGVNLFEELAEKRWGNSKDYISYKDNTSVFFSRLFK
jgi:steroid 5-alpha reductase family enzyme